MTRTCFAILALFATTIAQADDGFNNTSSWSDGGQDDGIRYYHGSDGSNGWETRSSGNAYFHSDKGNCSTNIGAVTQTTCIPY